MKEQNSPDFLFISRMKGGISSSSGLVFSLLDNEKPGAKRGGAAETGNEEEQEELAR